MNESETPTEVSAERQCLGCGRVHIQQPSTGRVNGFPRAGQWNDPEDGHPFRRESWEAVAQRLATRIESLQEAEAERTRERDECRAAWRRMRELPSSVPIQVADLRAERERLQEENERLRVTVASACAWMDGEADDAIERSRSFASLAEQHRQLLQQPPEQP